MTVRNSATHQPDAPATASLARRVSVVRSCRSISPCLVVFPLTPLPAIRFSQPLILLPEFRKEFTARVVGGKEATSEFRPQPRSRSLPRSGVGPPLHGGLPEIAAASYQPRSRGLPRSGVGPPFTAGWRG